MLHRTSGILDFGGHVRAITENYTLYTYHNLSANMVEQIQRLTGETRRFEAGGRWYQVHDTLTVDGFQHLEELRIEMEAGNTVGDLIKLTKQAYTLLNQGKMADAAVSLYNALNIEERVLEGRPQAWLLALTLFVRPEGADLSKWSESEAAEWIKEWNEEGYSVTDLFNLAFSVREKLDTGFSLNFPDTSVEAGESESAALKANRD